MATGSWGRAFEDRAEGTARVDRARKSTAGSGRRAASVFRDPPASAYLSAMNKFVVDWNRRKKRALLGAFRSAAHQMPCACRAAMRHRGSSK